MLNQTSVTDFRQLGHAGRALEDLGYIRVFEPGQSLFEQGEACRGIFFIVSGVVGLRRTSEDGETALLQLCKPGQVVGHAAFLGTTLHTTSAEVLTLCRVRFIDRTLLTRACERDAGIGQALLEKALADLDQAQSRCAALLTRDLKTRLIDTLMTFHAGQPGTANEEYVAVDLPIQRKDLAALIGAAPESLSRLIGKLEERGHIRVDGRRVYLWKRLTGMPAAPTPSAAGERMLKALMQTRTALLALLDTKDAGARRRLERRIEKFSSELDALLEDARDQDANFVAKFSCIWEQFKRTRQCEIIPAARAGNLIAARSAALGVQAERLARMQSALAGV